MTLGERMKARRESLGMSLSELARQAGISRAYLHLIETDAANPTLEKITPLAICLGLEVFFPDCYAHHQGNTDMARLLYLYKRGKYTEMIRMLASKIDEAVTS